MQAEGIKQGDRLDTYDARGRVDGGWTATGNAVVDDGYAYVPIRYHDGREDALVQPVGTQIPITFGVGNGPAAEHYVINNGIRYDVPTPPPAP